MQVDAPKVEAPKPKAEAPKPIAPKVEAPKAVEAPKVRQYFCVATFLHQRSVGNCNWCTAYVQRPVASTEFHAYATRHYAS
jgi:hypothetical protein